MGKEFFIWKFASSFIFTACQYLKICGANKNFFHNEIFCAYFTAQTSRKLEEVFTVWIVDLQTS